MKRFLLLTIICLPALVFGQMDSIHKKQMGKEIALEAKPVFVKATSLILELRNDVELAKQGLVKKSDVIKRFNETAGQVMGKQATFAAVDKKLKKDGDTYVKYLFLKEEARISYEKAAEAKFNAENQ